MDLEAMISEDESRLDLPVLTAEYLSLMSRLHGSLYAWANRMQGGLWC